MPPRSLKITEFSDRELLYIVSETSDANGGYCTSQEVADAIGLSAKHPASCVGSRLGWMSGLGLLDKDKERNKGTTLWRISTVGREFRDGDLSKDQRSTLDSMGRGELMMATRLITQRAKRSDTNLRVLKREWRYGTTVKSR